jgi:hypothetical protein
VFDRTFAGSVERVGFRGRRTALMVMRLRTALGAGFLAALFSVAPAMADDWTAQQLRGQVLQLVAQQWQPLNRGDVVPDARVIRTLGMGRVTFVRGGETIELGPNTQIQIHDRAGSKPFTTVTQYFGTVGVEADVRNVQHFAVDTPFLAAVVKGTKFVVTSGKTGTSVAVNRGHVAVDDHANHQHVTIAVGQSATVDTGNLRVAGSGVLPVVLDRHNQPVVTDDTTAASGTVVSSHMATTSGDDDGSGKSGKGKSGKSGSDNGSNSGKGSSGDGGNGSSGSGGSGDDNSGNGNGNSGSGNSGDGNGGDNSGSGNSGRGGGGDD